MFLESVVEYLSHNRFYIVFCFVPILDHVDMYRLVVIRVELKIKPNMMKIVGISNNMLFAKLHNFGQLPKLYGKIVKESKCIRWRVSPCDYNILK